MAFVQSVQSNQSGTHSNMTLVWTPTAGNSATVWFLTHTGSAYPVTISDTAGNTYVALSSNPYQPNGVSPNFGISGWTIATLIGGSQTITVGYNGLVSDADTIAVQEWSGRNASALLDVALVTGALEASNTLSHSTGSITTATAGDDIVACNGTSISQFTTQTFTAGSGWSLTDSFNNTSGIVGCTQRIENAAAGTYNDTWSQSANGCKGFSVILALAKSTGGGGGASLLLDSNADGGMSTMDGGMTCRPRTSPRIFLPPRNILVPAHL